MTGLSTNAYLARRPIVLGLAKVLFLTLNQIPAVEAAPLYVAQIWRAQEAEPEITGNLLIIYFAVAVFLVLLGGVFAGLTIAMMGQDEIYLQVIRDSGEGPEVKHAAKVLNLLHRGKHWVLVTLLLSNVITNETLPIVLDRSLGGGWPAVVGSTVLIVIFGEVVPQSVCVRYGLPIGAWMSPFVLVLMYIMAPVAWPTAKLLDYLLGTDHGTVYKKAGLKTLVSLHRSMGDAGQRLHADEVTIISAVLDLKEKAIGSIMTPMDDVFTLSLDDVLDEITMDDILTQGYSRVPVHHPDNDQNFIGMLLVKMLITYDPEDARPVRDFALATLPETSAETSCLDIVNFFQEGKSHMVLVSEHPGEDHGALGVVTLEDVIEELIGEEIIDESDVYVDVHKAIRRIAPAPRTRFPKTAAVEKASSPDLAQIGEHEVLDTKDMSHANGHDDVLKVHSTANRRISAHSNGDAKTSKRPTVEDLKEQLKHLGPSNAASRPKTTRYASVKIKPGSESQSDLPTERDLANGRALQSVPEFSGGIGEGLLTSGGRPASDGVQAVAHAYGTMSSSPHDRRPVSAHKSVQADMEGGMESTLRPDTPRAERRPRMLNNPSEDTIGELPDRNVSKSPYYQSRGPVRSGSITENIIDTGEFRKVVLETTSSSSSADEEDGGSSSRRQTTTHSERSSYEDRSSSSKLRGSSDSKVNDDVEAGSASKKQRRRRRKRDKDGAGESDPLLG